MPEVIDKRLFEYIDGTSNKYWEVSLVYSQNAAPRYRYSVVTRWGKRTGNRWKDEGGTSKTLKTFSTQSAASRFMREKIRSKTRTGYVEVKHKKKKKPAPTKRKEPSMEEASLQRFSLMADDL